MPSFFRRASNYVKRCSNCKLEYIVQAKSEDEAFVLFRKNFSPRRGAMDGLESGCYRCRAIADMRIRFGIDIEAMLKAQNNACAICHTKIKFNTGDNAISACVDHDHTTGETRGILCRHCNLGLGHFRDNMQLVLDAAKYLDTWKSERHQVDTIKRDA